MTTGLTAEGLVTPTLTEIREEIDETVRNQFGQSVDLSDAEPLGQLVGIFAEREALLWELVEAAYNAQSPSSATGAALESLAELTGTTLEASAAPDSDVVEP